MDSTPKSDGRKLKAEALHTLRLQIVRLHEAGRSRKEIAEITGLTEACVTRTLKKYREKGLEGLIPEKRGRRFGTQRTLTKEQEEEICKILKENTPDQVNLPFPLWGRDNIAMLIEDKFGIKMPLRTISSYLRRWGFTYKRPLKRSYAQQPDEVKEWLEEEFPQIKEQARQEGATIYWSDETGARNRNNGYYGFAPLGQTPVLRMEPEKLGIHMISAITNGGQVRFKLYESTLTSEIFMDFLGRLLPNNGKKIYVIVDNLKVHHSKKVQEWVKRHEERIKLFFLPAYSPELNPDEYLNNHLKRELRRRLHARTKEELRGRVERVMRKLSRRFKVVKNYFKHPNISYAA